MAPGTLSERPVRFSGTAAEADRNRRSHRWTPSGDCAECSAKPAHVAASYPCGAAVPREVYSTTLGRTLTAAERAAYFDEWE